MRNLVPTSHRRVAAAGLLRELAFDITRNLSLELQWPLNVNLDMNMDLALDLNLDLMLNVILNLHTHTHTHTHARVLFPSHTMQLRLSGSLKRIHNTNLSNVGVQLYRTTRVRPPV